ncbi:MAG: 2OG-Fe(II) oxygenase [Candidatus Sericytochromatia bacterium]|nr:2OG-Fe(II) oxygenase [Candidatus Sericytochromatia bacterium]
MSDFIETYDNVLDKDFCESLINKFETSNKKVAGTTGHGVNLTAKDSTDINISLIYDWTDEHKKVVALTLNHLTKYMRKYNHVLTGALTLSFPDPVTGKMIQVNSEVIDMIGDDTLQALMLKLYRLGTINLQKYNKGSGGYHHWHSEIYPQATDPKCDVLHRTLLFMYYLNDIEEGGETEFFYQAKKLKPKQGQLVIAPSGFTHTHKGNVPISSDKYILTSWVLFQKAKDLYK